MLSTVALTVLLLAIVIGLFVGIRAFVDGRMESEDEEPPPDRPIRTRRQS